MSEFDDRLSSTRFSRRQLLASSGAFAGVAAVTRIGGRSAAVALARGRAAGKTSTTLRYAESGSFATFNPWKQQPTEDDIANQLFSRLIYVDASGTPVGDLAQSWKLNSRDTRMEIKLRAGLTWQDGRAVTAHDFVRMYGFLSDPKLKSDIGVQKMTGLLGPVSAVKALGNDTVLLELKEPVPYIMDILSYWYLVNFDDPADTDFLKHLPIGTGPYKMTRFNPSSGAYLKAFDGYHGGRPAVDNLVFDTFSSGTSLISDLQSGLVDGVLVTNYADMHSIARSNRYYHTRAQTGVWDLMVNVAKPPFDKVAVRQALSYSLDRAQISKAAFFGYEKPVATPFYDPAATGYVSSLVNAQAFDLAKASRLLRSAGVTSLSMTFPVPVAYPAIQTLAEIWQADLAQIGITLEIQPVDSPLWESYITNPSTDVLIWNNGRCALDGAVFWSTQGNFIPGGADALGYVDPAVLELIDQGVRDVDVARRRAVYQQLNRAVVESAHCISIVTYSNTWAWSSRVRGESADLIGNLQLGGVRVQ